MSYKDYEKQKAFQRKWKKAQRVRYRLKAISLLGGECHDCGNKDTRVLEIDHIEPLIRDKASRFNNPKSGSILVQEILTGKTKIEELTLRCANCHTIKTLGERGIKYNCYGLL